MVFKTVPFRRLWWDHISLQIIMFAMMRKIFPKKKQLLSRNCMTTQPPEERAEIKKWGLKVLAVGSQSVNII